MALRDLWNALFRGNPAGEGKPHDGPWTVMNPSGYLPADWKEWNFWQLDHDPLPFNRRLPAVVEACVAAYATTIAQCPAVHWRALPNGGRERVSNSALARILKTPNEYQSFSDFIYNQVRQLYLTGNTYALAERNARFEVGSLHPFDSSKSKPLVGAERSIFYELAGNDIIEGGRDLANTWNGGGGWDYDNTTVGAGNLFGYVGADGQPSRLIVPARDCLHMKMETKPDKPLEGLPPLRHAVIATAVQNAIGSQLINLFANANRMPGVVETDLNFTEEQVKQLRSRINEAWRGVNNLDSGPPILTNGLKFHGIALNAKDAELAAIMKMSQDEIFMVFGVPPAILGLTDRATFSSTEALMQFWLSRGLGFALNHIETAFDQFFGLKGWPDEYVEFDTQALQRVAFKDRIEALTRGVQGGIFAPNEARKMEDLGAAEAGDEPRVQQQVVPLSAWNITPASAPAPDAPPSAPAPDATAEPIDEPAKDFTAEDAQRVADVAADVGQKHFGESSHAA